MESLRRRMECERAVTGRTTFHTLIELNAGELLSGWRTRWEFPRDYERAAVAPAFSPIVRSEVMKKTNKMWVKWLCKATLRLLKPALFPLLPAKARINYHRIRRRVLTVDHDGSSADNN